LRYPAAVSSPKPSFTARSPKLSFVHETLHAAFAAGDGLAHMKVLERAQIDTLHQFYGALGTGDIDAFLAFFTDDVIIELHVPEEFQFKSYAEGKLEARELILGNFSRLESQAPRIVSVVAQGDMVIVTLKEIGVIRATGAPYSVQLSQHFTFRGGKIWHFTQIAASLKG
jgi:ketosteroid isomerase-like protein